MVVTLCPEPPAESQGDVARGEVHPAQDNQAHEEHQLSDREAAQAQLLTTSHQVHREEQEHI
jgi:hypothetical protein